VFVLLLLQQVFLTADQLRAWGWRIPFAIGAVLAIIALFMRRNLHETDEFIAAKNIASARRSISSLMQYPREVLLVVGLTMGGTTAFYTYTTYMQKFLKLSVGLNDNEATLVTASSLIFALVLQPAYGALSDRIGRKTLLMVRGDGNALHHPAAARPAGGPQRFDRLPVDRRGLAYRRRLHLDQRRRQSRAVSDQGQGAGRGLAVRPSRYRYSAARRNRLPCGSRPSATRAGFTITWR